MGLFFVICGFFLSLKDKLSRIGVVLFRGVFECVGSDKILDCDDCAVEISEELLDRGRGTMNYCSSL